MNIISGIIVSLSIITILFKNIQPAIDMNAAELQYLADHLTPEECRMLMAALQFQSYEKPNVLDQAERKVPKDLSCIKLLHHWNADEGKGETHEVLQHRLRQMGKSELADWLGKNTFRNLGQDLNRSLESGLASLATEISTISMPAIGPTLEAIVETDEMQWTPLDTVLYALIVGLAITIAALCLRFYCLLCCNWVKKRRKRRRLKNVTSGYDVIETETSGSESEDRFDVRNYSRKE